MTTSTDPLGYGLLATLCTVSLPYPVHGGGVVMQLITCVQLTMGIAIDPSTGATLPSVASGRQKLAGDLLLRLSTPRGTLSDVNIPTTTAQYGYDLLDNLNADMTARDVGMMSARCDANLVQDERVVSSRTKAVVAGDIALVPIVITDGKGPFKLTLAANLAASNLALFTVTP